MPEDPTFSFPSEKYSISCFKWSEPCHVAQNHVCKVTQNCDNPIFLIEINIWFQHVMTWHVHYIESTVTLHESTCDQTCFLMKLSQRSKMLMNWWQIMFFSPIRIVTSQHVVEVTMIFDVFDQLWCYHREIISIYMKWGSLMSMCRWFSQNFSKLMDLFWNSLNNIHYC